MGRRDWANFVSDAEQMLKSFEQDSGTGPDLLPTRILKLCAKELAKPILSLTKRILETGEWPEPWLVHWVVPLYKKKIIFDPSN